ncbi:MAG: hypothetical protein Q4G44_07365 [Alcaligenaceae bacterium]|nr:hypothetical protein [Alcaligenaceae bacterium]
MKQFKMTKNACLDRDVLGLYHAEWYGARDERSPRFVYSLKNDFLDRTPWQLNSAKQQLRDVLLKDFGRISQVVKRPLTVCVVPRAKKEKAYQANQLLFKTVVGECAANTIGFVDGTAFIIRTVNTFTTHLSRPMEGHINDGSRPYRGIAIDSCEFSSEISGRDILLVDDVYTKSSNIDEDMVQALFDQGARSVIFYAVGYTVFRNQR